MQSVLIDDRRIHVDFSQSVSKLHKDWISKRTGGKESMGGFDNLQKRTRYREGEGRSNRGEGYDLVFDTDKKDSKRQKIEEDKNHRSSSRRDDRKDRKSDSSYRRDDKRDDRRDSNLHRERRSDDRDRRRGDDRGRDDDRRRDHGRRRD